MIQQIANNESGSSVRNKLNELITLSNGPSNQVDVTLGSGGINTIGQALQLLTEYKRVYQAGLGTIRGTVTISNNYTMNESIYVVGENYGWIEIRVMGGATVTVGNVPTNSITEYQVGATVRAPFFAKNGGVLPILSGGFTLGSGSNADNLVGLYGPNSSLTLRARGDTTILDANGVGNHCVAAVYGASFVARECSIINAGTGNNLNITNGSIAAINDCTVTGAGNNDINALRGSRIILHKSTYGTTNSDDSSEIYIST